MGIAPSLLYPTSTRTSLEPTWTTRPRTTSPSSNPVTPCDTRPPSVPRPRRRPPRAVRRGNALGRSSYHPFLPSLLFASNCRYRRPARARTVGAAVLEPRDRLHHL